VSILSKLVITALMSLLSSDTACFQRTILYCKTQQVERDDLEERLSSILQLGSATALKRFAIEREQVYYMYYC
jgi:hypothetical protein